MSERVSELQTYYLELVERIYREEVPLQQPERANQHAAGCTEHADSGSQKTAAAITDRISRSEV